MYDTYVKKIKILKCCKIILTIKKILCSIEYLYSI